MHACVQSLSNVGKAKIQHRHPISGEGGEEGEESDEDDGGSGASQEGGLEEEEEGDEPEANEEVSSTLNLHTSVLI